MNYRKGHYSLEIGLDMLQALVTGRFANAAANSDDLQERRTETSVPREELVYLDGRNYAIARRLFLFARAQFDWNTPEFLE